MAAHSKDMEHIISRSPEYIPFPKWCVKTPVLTKETNELIHQSWRILMSSESKGLKKKSIFHYDSTATQPGSEYEYPLPGATMTGTTPPKEQTILEDSPKVVAKPSPPSLRSYSSKQESKASKESKETIDVSTFFYDTFFKRLIFLNPKLQSLFGGNIKQQSKLLIKICKSLLNLHSKRNEEEFNKQLDEMVAEFNRLGLSAEDYDTVGLALLMALEFCLGMDFNQEVRTAWVNAYSMLMIKILPQVESERFFIKKEPSRALLFNKRSPDIKGAAKSSKEQILREESFDSEDSRASIKSHRLLAAEDSPKASSCFCFS